MSDRNRAWLAMALLVPVPSLAVLVGLILYPDTVAGRALYVACKIYVALFPLGWLLLVEKQPLAFRWPRRGLAAGVVVGALMAAAVIIAYLVLAERFVDVHAVRQLAASIDIDRPIYFVAMAVYWSIVNALIEEYVWRWFMLRQARRVISDAGAVVLSSLCFTLHHVFALQIYLSWSLALLASLGVFIAGAIWCSMYIKYRSIVPGFISHVIADAAIFAAGYVLIFG